VLGAKVSAPDLATIGVTSLLYAPAISLRSFTTVKDKVDNAGILYLAAKSSITIINIKGVTDKDDIKEESNGQSILSNYTTRHL